MGKSLKIIKSLAIIILSIVYATIGVQTIKIQSNIEINNGSFSKTNMDYILEAPSKEQISTFKNNSNVNGIFTCKTYLIKDRGVEFNVMFSDNMDSFNNGLFNNEMLLEGKYDENNWLIDQTAANKLNLKVGDNYKITIKNQEINKVIAGIYMPIKYSNYDSGILLTKWVPSLSENGIMKSNVAFLDVKDKSNIGNMLDGYKPLGALISQEEFISKRKAENNNVPPTGFTDEEWTESLITRYETYRNNFINQDHVNAAISIESLSKDLSNSVDRYGTNWKKMESLVIGIGVSFILVMLAYMLIIRNKENKNNYKNGASAVGIIIRDLVIAIVSMLVVALPTTIAVNIISGSLYQADSVIEMCKYLTYGLSVYFVVAIVLILINDFFLVRRNNFGVGKTVIDNKINEREEFIKEYSKYMALSPDIDYNYLAKITKDFNEGEIKTIIDIATDISKEKHLDEITIKEIEEAIDYFRK